MAPFNGTSDEMAALGRCFREKGLYTFVRWNTFFANPPLVITEAQLDEGLRDRSTRRCEITDRAVTDWIARRAHQARHIMATDIRRRSS